jgi:aminobenzoyl-glutamate transport protein
MVAGFVLLVLTALPEGSAWRAPAGRRHRRGELLVGAAPLMQSIVALIFVFFLMPGMIYGYVAGTVKNHRDIIAGMTKAMSGMGYYIVMAFFAAQFIYAFGQSNLGALLAIKGANWLQAMGCRWR